MKLGIAKRKSIHISSSNLIKTQLMQPDSLLPLLVQPTVEGLDLATWAASNRDWIETQLLKHGGILFRGFKVNGATEFEQFIQTIAGELLEYSYRSTPRSRVSGNIYTSTEYPAAQSIPLHNEMAYSLSWPLKIGFFCVKPAQQGGETPIADSRKVFQRVDFDIKARFEEKKVMYVRNYGEKLDLPWQDVFQTTSKSVVERYCRSANIQFDWIDDDHLRTYQVCQAVATHPKTGEMVWFNQAHLFHVSSLNSEVYQSLLATFKTGNFPRNAYYGDGSPIESWILDEIRKIYQEEAVIFPWQANDILLLDNMLAAHGRMPFQGDRKVLVGMAESFNG